MAKRVLFTATLVRGHIAKFHIPYLKWFKEQGWETWVAAKNDYPDGKCEIPYCDQYIDIDFARSPFSKQTLTAYKQLRNLFQDNNFDLVHTHTPVGSVLTRFAARQVRKIGTEVIYTAHGFHFFKGAPIANWILWYPVEKVMSRFTDTVITINDEDFKRASSKFHCDVKYVPGVGVDVEALARRSSENDSRKEFGFPDDSKLLLCVGDLIKRKNHQLVINSLQYLDEKYCLAICGDGPEQENLVSLANSLGVLNRVRFLGFRRDVPEIMHQADLLVFPSIHEGLPVSVLEAMSCNLPVLASNIRGIFPDLINDSETGYIIKDCNSESLAKQIIDIVSDKEELAAVSIRAKERVSRFDIARVIDEVSKIYLSCGEE